MIRRLPPLVAASLFACLLTFIVTWPQVLHPTEVVDHFDPYFSIWRLGHIAHALSRWPVDLFDANIFYPARHTFAYSDATLLQGILAAPLLWGGLPPSLVYNLILLVGFAGSGAGMYVLARHLTGDPAASLVATTLFTSLPYRIEHVMHVELQWAMFVPLTLWAVHRTMESGSWRHGLLTGLFLWLQFLSCVYYGVFLSLSLLIFVPVLLTVKGHAPFRTFVPPLLVGGMLAALLTFPYAWQYVLASREVGARPLDEITRYSALPISYLASPSFNRWWGWTADIWGGPELRLFPGLLAIALAIAAFWHPRRRMVLLYAVTTLVVVQLSFGMNGTLYRLLLGQVSSLQGFRALARFGIITACTMSVLAALGTQVVVRRLRAPLPVQRAIVPIIILLMVIEYSNTPLPLSQPVDAATPDVYKVLARAKPGPIAEFPLPNPHALPGYDPYYQAWSVWHWRPLLNGYSGFYSRAYMEVLPKLDRFPDAKSIATLREHGIVYVIVHRAFYTPDEYTELALKLATAPGLAAFGVYKDPYGPADIFEVLPE
jgi:hypothetical protein